MTKTSVLGAVGAGLVAGAAGTAVMTAYQELVGRLRGRSALAAQMKEPPTWADAPAPAQVARKVAGVFHQRVTKKQVPALTTAIHWSYGTMLGAAYGLAQTSLRSRPVAHGAAFGTAVWLGAYAVLSPLAIYEPIWRYPPKTLAVDLSYHLVYGLGVAGAYESLRRV